jgi:hypothetical protein
MKIRNLISAATAAGLLIAPVAVQAGTSAAASVPGVGARASSGVAEANKVKGGTLIAVVLATGAVIWGIKEATDDKSNGS